MSKECVVLPSPAIPMAVIHSLGSVLLLDLDNSLHHSILEAKIVKVSESKNYYLLEVTNADTAGRSVPYRFWTSMKEMQRRFVILDRVV
jgi:hypothetical protein